MSLYLNERDKYADTYDVNWAYLRNMTSLQMKPLNEMAWTGKYKKYIYDRLWFVPNAWASEIVLEDLIKQFINDLNIEIMGL
jgi:hypothetical protein